MAIRVGFERRQDSPVYPQLLTFARQMSAFSDNGHDSVGPRWAAVDPHATFAGRTCGPEQLKVSGSIERARSLEYHRYEQRETA